MENLIIIGTGTNAKMAYEFVKDYNLYNIIGFAVNSEYKKETTFYDLPVYCLEELKNKKDVRFKIFISLLWNRLNRDRRNLFEYCEKQELDFASLISPHAIISRSSTYGRNCWIHDFAVIQNTSSIGDNVVMRQYAMIAANCTVESHCFLGIRSLLGGGSKVGEQCFIGMGATIFDTTKIGNKCIIGACTAVKRNMPSFSKISLSAESVSIKQYSEDEIETKLIHTKNVR